MLHYTWIWRWSIRNHTKKRLININCPILILQTEDDDTTKTKSTDYIYNQVSSKRKKIQYFSEGGHLILLSKSANQVIKYVKDFLKEDL